METPLFLLERGSPCRCSAGLLGRQPCHSSTRWPCGPGVRIVSSLACQESSAAVPSRAGAAGSASCPALGRPVSSARKRRCPSRKGLPHQRELKVGVVWRSQHRPCVALVTQPSPLDLGGKERRRRPRASLRLGRWSPGSDLGWPWGLCTLFAQTPMRVGAASSGAEACSWQFWGVSSTF